MLKVNCNNSVSLGVVVNNSSAKISTIYCRLFLLVIHPENYLVSAMINLFSELSTFAT